jgi:hypothetical protein
MSFLTGLVGCCQQGEGSAPTGVSVATSSSGNYDDSFIIDFQNGFSSGTAYTDHDGSTSGVTIFTNTWDSHYSGEGDSDMKIKAYMRATNATSYAWTLSITDNLSNNDGVSQSNIQSTAQDATGDGCINVNIDYGSSRPSHPEAGDTLVLALTGTATNSDGSTSATITKILTWT